jgi:hypothetical protein
LPIVQARGAQTPAERCDPAAGCRALGFNSHTRATVAGNGGLSMLPDCPLSRLGLLRSENRVLYTLCLAPDIACRTAGGRSTHSCYSNQCTRKTWRPRAAGLCVSPGWPLAPSPRSPRARHTRACLPACPPARRVDRCSLPHAVRVLLRRHRRRRGYRRCRCRCRRCRYCSHVLRAAATGIGSADGCDERLEEEQRRDQGVAAGLPERRPP